MRRLAAMAVGAAALAGAASRARAYDFDVAVRTVGQGYQLRRFSATGGSELLNRRRLTQYLDLSVWNIEADAWRGPGGDRNQLHVDVSVRFDSDFGGYMLNRPRGDGAIAELQQNQIDVLTAVVAGRGIGGRLDFQIGRQLHYDLVDFYAFDGAHVTLHLPARLAVESFGGLEVRGELPVSAPIYELDGTSAGSRDPRTRPAQNQALAPTAGAALALVDAAGLDARVAYRRTWSATADRVDGDPASGVDEEKLALTGGARLGRVVFLTGGLRWNLLTGGFDDEQASARVRLGARHALVAEYAYLAPTFDGDSIWNVFSAGAYRDARLGWDFRVCEALEVHARGFLRLFEQTADEAALLAPGSATPLGGRAAWGGTAGARWRTPRAHLRGDVFVDDGYGGQRLGGDLSARWAWKPGRTDLEGRLTVWSWRSDTQPDSNRGIMAGAQVGSQHRLTQGMRLHLLVEDNADSFYLYQFRGLVLLDVDVTL